jgi:spore maturation protein CgeB
VPPYSDEVLQESLSKNFYNDIKHYIENPKDRKAMAQKNYEWVMENRNQKDISKKLQKILCN